MICAFSAQCRVVNASPNVPFAALTLRWAIDGLGFQPVFCGAIQTNPNESEQIPRPASDEHVAPVRKKRLASPIKNVLPARDVHVA